MIYLKQLTVIFFIFSGIINAKTWEHKCVEFCSLGSKYCKFDYIPDCRENVDKARNIICYDVNLGDDKLNYKKECRIETYNKCLEITESVKLDTRDENLLGDTSYYCTCNDAIKGNNVEKIETGPVTKNGELFRGKIGKSKLEVCDEKGSKFTNNGDICIGNQKTVECFRTVEEINSDCFNKEGLPFCRNIKGLFYI